MRLPIAIASALLLTPAIPLVAYAESGSGIVISQAETKPAETKAPEAKAETKGSEAKPADAKPAETKAPEAKPAEAAPAAKTETKPAAAPEKPAAAAEAAPAVVKGNGSPAGLYLWLFLIIGNAIGLFVLNGVGGPTSAMGGRRL